MIDLGGKNLPKSISTRLGAKLAKIYKKVGIDDVKIALIKSYEVLNSIPEIKRIDEKTIEVKIKYEECFCPIGGDPNPDNPEKAKIIQDSICTPYTVGFINEFNPDFAYDGQVKECILSSGSNTCRYILYLSDKQNDGNND